MSPRATQATTVRIALSALLHQLGLARPDAPPGGVTLAPANRPTRRRPMHELQVVEQGRDGGEGQGGTGAGRHRLLNDAPEGGHVDRSGVMRESHHHQGWTHRVTQGP